MKTAGEQRGFTLIELSAVMAVISIIVSGTGYMIWSQIEQLNLSETVGNGNRVAETAELYRHVATASAPGPGGAMTYTYVEYPGGISADNFNATHGTSVPETSAYGTPYTIFIEPRRAYVTVQIPVDVDPVGVDSVALGGGSTRLTFESTVKGGMPSMALRFTHWQKRVLYQEPVR